MCEIGYNFTFGWLRLYHEPPALPRWQQLEQLLLLLRHAELAAGVRSSRDVLESITPELETLRQKYPDLQAEFAGELTKYSEFLEIMKSSKSGHIDVSVVVQRVSALEAWSIVIVSLSPSPSGENIVSAAVTALPA